jgi:hypothetical protein
VSVKTSIVDVRDANNKQSERRYTRDKHTIESTTKKQQKLAIKERMTMAVRGTIMN